MALDRSTQPIVKDASGVLVGVAQIRVGKPSIREAGTAVVAPKIVAVGKSQKAMAVSNNSVCLVKPNVVWSANGLAAAPNATIDGEYTGKIDGCIILRAAAVTGNVAETSSSSTASAIECFDTYGRRTIATGSYPAGVTATIQGVTITADFTGANVGDTWVLPVWTGAAISIQQTGIVSPFSMFYDATDSIGGLKSASFQPKIDSVKKLQSGFPSYVADQIVDSVSVEVQWNGYEYTNSKLALLKQMIARVINTGELSAISVEMVMRTRGGSLVRMWLPTCTFMALPTYAPTNDYSDVQFHMSALKQTEFSTITTAMGLDSLVTTGAPSELQIYNAWLSDAPIYQELAY
ncbi:hypothetical protein [Geobacter sp. SVR]|uniref:hypothetical protein n=1 Tax=Geobacter sp. SVR TaxID=2495594 RepID=UPI00143F02AE|nr:hypothetical protein [Geobacter sp. SVR]BCS54036.1 hypothetical protein GSVR_23440 [Geobacter sp. SVR]GCF86183.1 hypothetical protein GSbR_27830 [Geobacter sp. SVR]